MRARHRPLPLSFFGPGARTTLMRWSRRSRTPLCATGRARPWRTRLTGHGGCGPSSVGGQQGTGSALPSLRHNQRRFTDSWSATWSSRKSRPANPLLRWDIGQQPMRGGEVWPRALLRFSPAGPSTPSARTGWNVSNSFTRKTIRHRAALRRRAVTSSTGCCPQRRPPSLSMAICTYGARNPEIHSPSADRVKLFRPLGSRGVRRGGRDRSGLRRGRGPRGGVRSRPASGPGRTRRA